MIRYTVRSTLGAALAAALLCAALPRPAVADTDLPPVTPFKPPCPTPAKCTPAQLQALDGEVAPLVAQIKIAIETLLALKEQIAAARAEKKALQDQMKRLDANRPAPPVRGAEEDADAFDGRMDAYEKALVEWSVMLAELKDQIEQVERVLTALFDALAKVKIEIAALEEKIGAVLKYTTDVAASLPPAHGFRDRLLEGRGRVAAEGKRLQAAVKQLPKP